MSQESRCSRLSIAIDTGKNVLHVIGLDEKGAVVLRERVSRSRIAARLVNVRDASSGSRVGCARHEVKQLPAAYAKPFRQG